MTALSLPKFTFLCGPNTPEKRALATLIAAQDEELWLGEFESPLREATIALFFDNDLTGHDLTKPEERAAQLPSFEITVEDWLVALRNGLETNVDIAAVGKIALTTWQGLGLEDVFAHFLYCDVDHSSVNVQVFLDFAGKDNCLCINIGNVFATRVPPGRTICLPHIEAAKNLEFLRHELLANPK